MKICGVIANDQKQELDKTPQLQAGGLLTEPTGELIHKFRNTITAVIGYSELALHAVEERHQARAWLEKVGVHTGQLGSLSNKLIDLERLQHDGQP